MKRTRHDRLRKRHESIRRRIIGTSERPRLSVHRSLKNLYVQVINDLEARTLISFSTRDKGFVRVPSEGGKVGAAEKLGAAYAAKMKEKGILKIAFDRGGYQYHGRVKALAEALRQGGIQF